MQRSCLPEANSLNALDADFSLLMKVLKRCLVLFLFGFFVLDFFLSGSYLFKFAINYTAFNQQLKYITHNKKRSIRSPGKEV